MSSVVAHAAVSKWTLCCLLVLSIVSLKANISLASVGCQRFCSKVSWFFKEFQFVCSSLQLLLDAENPLKKGKSCAAGPRRGALGEITNSIAANTKVTHLSSVLGLLLFPRVGSEHTNCIAYGLSLYGFISCVETL